MLECMHEITEHVSSMPFNSSSEWKHSKHGFPRVPYRMEVPDMHTEGCLQTLLADFALFSLAENTQRSNTA